MRHLFLTIYFYTFSWAAKAQEITGTWEEYSDTRFTSYTKLCIVKICDRYIGYIFDRDNDNGHCKADFIGAYNKKRQLLQGETTGFMEQTPGHVLATYTLHYKKEGGDEILEGAVYEKPDSLYQMIDGRPRLIITDDPRPEFIRFIRTGKVTDSTAYMQLMALKPCKNDPPPVVATRPAIKEEKVIEKRVTDTAIMITPAAVITPRENSIEKPLADTASIINPAASILQMQNSRLNDTISVISTIEKELTVRVVDNAITDGDTISIIHNRELIAERILVSAKPYPIKIILSKEHPYHELVLVAHNLGSIPPNTALLLISYGNREYRVHAIADLSKNAMIIFKYTGQ